MLNKIFWKPGINGLGVFGFHKLPCRIRFDKAAKQHDLDYDKGGNSRSRMIADDKFLKNELRSCVTTTQKVLAYTYYGIVRLFGNMFFNYNN